MNETVIQGISLDSRRVKAGDLFIAFPGLTVDGRDFIPDAIEKGAAAVLYEGHEPLSALQTSVPLIPIPNLHRMAGFIAARFFDEPSKQLSVIGITGTAGKTSTAYFIAILFSACHKRCALMGTLGVGFLNALTDTGCTTQEVILNHQSLAHLKKAGAECVAMEVTSHALAQGRVEGIQFEGAIFTNLSVDHLDYHHTLAQYRAEKQKLFTEHQPAFSIINVEDEWGQSLFLELQQKRQPKLLGFTTQAIIPPRLNQPAVLKDTLGIVTTSTVKLSEAGIEAFIETPWGQGRLQCALLGRFNLSNLLAALLALKLHGIPFERILEAVPLLTTVPGRMMRFGGEGQKPLVVVDYSHKPEALAAVLTLLRAHCRGKLLCVVGCGGDRDKSKRPLMAAHVERLCEDFIFTSDNPRTEDQDAIFKDMLSGLIDPNVAIVEVDRKKAIQAMIAKAGPHDVVLVAGKGNETYQIIGTEKRFFSDIEEVQAALEKV